MFYKELSPYSTEGFGYHQADNRFPIRNNVSFMFGKEKKSHVNNELKTFGLPTEEITRKIQAR